MTKNTLKKVAQWGGIDVTRYDKKNDLYGSLFEKYRQFTMIPKVHFMDNLRLCNQYKDAPGDFVECGVWRGGMSAAISEILGKHWRIHLFDSFEGLPPAKDIDGRDAIAWQKNIQAEGYYNNCAADESFALEAMKAANHQNYKLYKGWFQNTLSNIEAKSLSIIRLDGDWYDSIKICLDLLFPKLNEGGIVIIDDYYSWEGCSKAVHDYLSEVKSPSRIYQWNNNIAYIIKRN
jgi:O-methyltransferase